MSTPLAQLLLWWRVLYAMGSSSTLAWQITDGGYQTYVHVYRSRRRACWCDVCVFMAVWESPSMPKQNPKTNQPTNQPTNPRTQNGEIRAKTAHPGEGTVNETSRAGGGFLVARPSPLPPQPKSMMMYPPHIFPFARTWAVSGAPGDWVDAVGWVVGLGRASLQAQQNGRRRANERPPIVRRPLPLPYHIYTYPQPAARRQCRFGLPVAGPAARRSEQATEGGKHARRRTRKRRARLSAMGGRRARRLCWDVAEASNIRVEGLDASIEGIDSSNRSINRRHGRTRESRGGAPPDATTKAARRASICCWNRPPTTNFSLHARIPTLSSLVQAPAASKGRAGAVPRT